MTTDQSLIPMDALNRLLEISLGFAVSQTFFSACQLGLFEALSAGPATTEQLAERLGIHPLGCRRLMSALQQLSLVERDGECYRNSALGSYCTAGSPVQLEPLAMWGSPFYHMWEFLPDALREYGPRWQQALGTSAQEVFAALYEDPARLRRFTQLLTAMGQAQGEVIAERVDFDPYQCLLDVAGGPGSIAIPIGLRHPHLRGIIMDLPPVCALAQEHIARNGLDERFTTAAADLFAGPYPAGADVILLGSILHDWNDDDCGQILRQCYAALPPHGTLFVVEKVLNNDYSGTTAALMMDLHMLVVSAPGGRERSEAEYRALLEQTGFTDVEIVRFDAPRDLIIARRG
jgi:2-polyprenyl-3-methyl-5-hydroxy-6-metoxy-1,4-benzoquinol methylase